MTSFEFLLQELPATASTISTSQGTVEGVEAVVAPDWVMNRHPKIEWIMEDGLDSNFSKVGMMLKLLNLPLFRHPDGGLVLVEDNRPHRITSSRELAPFLIDNLRISVTKNGKYRGEKPAEGVLNNMLMSRTFLSHFQRVEDVVTTPVVLEDFTHSMPGYNPLGGVLYLGRGVESGNGLEMIERYLDVVEWQGNADRTNAVAAALTLPFRRHFPGGKPFVLVTATKSHAGKGTLIEFIRGKASKAEIAYEDKDWPMQRNLHQQLFHNPEIGVINFDNVRTDSSGRSRIIRTGFLESFITNAEIVMSSAASQRKPIRTANKFVVLLNTNEGSLSIDLLNRSLPIRLEPVGDLTERIERAKAVLGGDVKHEWLPTNQVRIEAELWGMIGRWLKEGKPLDTAVKHPMGPWAATIGGILMVNGFKDFLSNYSTTRATSDPIREALGILALHAGKEPKRAGDLAKIAVTLGLNKTLLAGADPSNIAACERTMGVLLTPYVGESFTITTASERITFRFKKESKRWNGDSPHFRYIVQETKREPVTDDALSGLVLEEPD